MQRNQHARASFGIVPLGKEAIESPPETPKISVVLKEGNMIEVTFPKPERKTKDKSSPNTTLKVVFKVYDENMTFKVENGVLLVNGSPAKLVQLRDRSGYVFEVYSMRPDWEMTIPGGLGLKCGILSTVVEQTYSIRGVVLDGVVLDENGVKVKHPVKVTRKEASLPVPQQSATVEVFLRAGAGMKRLTFDALPNLWTRESKLISEGREVVLEGGQLKVA